MLSPLEQVLLALLLVVLMVGMGATLTVDAFREVVRKPRGPLIGLASQFGWMPLIAFGLAHALALPPELAIGLIVVGCTPGGTTSNLFTYYARADLALSITMTALSSVAAVVLMPLALRVYAAPFSSATLVVPYTNIAATLALMLVPMGIGMAVRHRSSAAAARVERAGSVAGLAVLALLIGTGLVRNGHLLVESPPTVYAAALGLGVVGFGLGYLSARLGGLGPAARRAVAFETGIQNSPLALGILMTSFPAELHAQLLWLSLLYALFIILSSAALAAFLRTRPLA